MNQVPYIEKDHSTPELIDLAKRLSKLREVWVYLVRDSQGEFQVIRFAPVAEVECVYYFPKEKLKP